MPLSGSQFGKQMSPTPRPTSFPSMGSMGATPLPNAPIPKPGATMSAPPLPNAVKGRPYKITKL